MLFGHLRIDSTILNGYYMRIDILTTFNKFNLNLLGYGLSTLKVSEKVVAIVIKMIVWKLRFLKENFKSFGTLYKCIETHEHRTNCDIGDLHLETLSVSI